MGILKQIQELANPKPPQQEQKRPTPLPEPLAPCCKKNVAPLHQQLVDAAKGVVSAGKVVLQINPSTEEEQSTRIAICRACKEVDTKGERLFRNNGGEPTCGVPLIDHIIRDKVADGCGCYLLSKVKGKNEACPRGKWS